MIKHYDLFAGIGGFSLALDTIFHEQENESINIHGQMTGVKLRLQPAMTEWMMGYPDGWTELPRVEKEETKSQLVSTVS